MARRYYSSTAARTTLATGVNNSTTTLSVVAVSGWPASYPYTLIIDQDTANEEIVSVTNRSGTTLTVTRGQDGTSAVAHDAGAAVNHGVSARDFDEPNAFINGTGVVTETLLGTGAVTSAKILDGTIVNADINASAAIAQSKIADLTSDLAEKVPYAYGTATPSTTVEGFVWFDENDTPPTPKFWDGAAFQALTSGKILQIVRATDSTDRTTTSTTPVDVTGASVTITPQRSNSAVLVIAIFQPYSVASGGVVNASIYRLTDNSNNTILGGTGLANLFSNAATNATIQVPSAVLWGYSTPATTSATTYKMRFNSGASASCTTGIQGSATTTQLYAIEVSA